MAPLPGLIGEGRPKMTLQLAVFGGVWTLHLESFEDIKYHVLKQIMVDTSKDQRHSRTSPIVDGQNLAKPVDMIANWDQYTPWN